MLAKVRVLVLSTILLVGVYCDIAHSDTDDFFKGKTVRIVVGFTAGGAFDAYSRMIARHMGQYLPGNPTIIVENMTGAGSLVAANHVYKAAKPDGLSIGNFIGGLFMGQVLGRPGIEFDALKFEYIGSPMRENTVCVTTKASDITTFEKWRTTKLPCPMLCADIPTWSLTIKRNRTNAFAALHPTLKTLTCLRDSIRSAL